MYTSAWKFLVTVALVAAAPKTSMKDKATTSLETVRDLAHFRRAESPVPLDREGALLAG